MLVVVPVPTLPGLVCYHGHRAQSCASHSERGLADGCLLHSFQRRPLYWVQPPSDPQNVALSGAKTDRSLLDCHTSLVTTTVRVPDAFRAVQMNTTCGFGHAPLSDVFASWHSATFRAGLLPLFVAPLPVWVGLEVGFFDLPT